MHFQMAFSLSNVVQRWICCFSRFCLAAVHQFFSSLASNICTQSASSYCFGSTEPTPCGCALLQFEPAVKSELPVLASDSNFFGQTDPRSAVGLPRPSAAHSTSQDHGITNNLKYFRHGRFSKARGLRLHSRPFKLQTPIAVAIFMVCATIH